ncbi:unnamed protein product [Sphagnum jensenii]|uniref:PNPLA domain-containing protein n=1 Tax=Sphagnum jensenii TaxID=128206 RepID=A0ABP1APM3_9BRYO
MKLEGISRGINLNSFMSYIVVGLYHLLVVCGISSKIPSSWKKLFTAQAIKIENQASDARKHTSEVDGDGSLESGSADNDSAFFERLDFLEQRWRERSLGRDSETEFPETTGPHYPCALMLSFTCGLSEMQERKWVERLKNLYGGAPQVERLAFSTVVQTQAWTYDDLLCHAEIILQQAHEDDNRSTLQLDSWGLLLNSTGKQVKLLKLQGIDVPVITSVVQVCAETLEIEGVHLDGVQIMASTNDHITNLLSISQISRGTKGPVLTVQCPSEYQNRGLQVYAAKPVNIEGSYISVHSEPAHVSVVDVSESSTDPSTSVLMLLTMAIPVAQISWSMLFPSRGSTAAAVVGQVLGWILGWLTLQLLATRYMCHIVEGESDGKWDWKIWKPCAAFVAVVLVSFLSWTQVLGPRAVIVVTVATVIIGLAISGRIKHFGSHKAVKITSRHAYWTKLMDASITYDEWAQAASMLVPEGDLNESMLYDEAFVQGKLSELQQRRMEGSVQEIIFSLRADLSRNLGNMCNPQLHIRRQQIPRLVHEYQNEVRHHLHAICEMNPEEFTLEEKLTCMMETRQNFGRTALVFSGHVAFGTFHTSVFRTLVEHQVLPSIVVGVNVGAIVSSFATTRTSGELQYFFDHPAPPMQFYEKMCAAYVAAYRLSTQDASTYEIEKLQQSMQDLIGDLTFEEAFELSGRVLGISIPACRLGNQPSQFLNYLTSPHVVIWSAVAVSCAPPVGLLAFPELMIKNRAGEIVHYLPPTRMTAAQRQGCNASLETELPLQKLRELFNVNHFIISQSSPYIAPILHLKETIQAHGGLRGKLAKLAEIEVKHWCSHLADLGIEMGGFTSLYAQNWEADINIVLPMGFSQVISATVSHAEGPSPDELRKTAMAGRHCVWAKLSAIQASCGIELMLDDCIFELNRRIQAPMDANREDEHMVLDEAYSPTTGQSEIHMGWPKAATDTINTINEDDMHEHVWGHRYLAASEAASEDYLLDLLCSCTMDGASTPIGGSSTVKGVGEIEKRKSIEGEETHKTGNYGFGQVPEVLSTKEKPDRRITAEQHEQETTQCTKKDGLPVTPALSSGSQIVV